MHKRLSYPSVPSNSVINHTMKAIYPHLSVKKQRKQLPQFTNILNHDLFTLNFRHNSVAPEQIEQIKDLIGNHCDIFFFNLICVVLFILISLIYKLKNCWCDSHSFHVLSLCICIFREASQRMMILIFIMMVAGDRI